MLLGLVRINMGSASRPASACSTPAGLTAAGLVPDPEGLLRLRLNPGWRGELVGDGALVAGDGGRGVVDLLDEQGEGAGDAGRAGVSRSTVIAAGVKVMTPASDHMNSTRWRTSSYSGGNGGECVQVAATPSMPRLLA
ncbi:MAG: DUF397 domain-containing protein, partial [Streptosporangiaceae bacterium]